MSASTRFFSARSTPELLRKSPRYHACGGSSINGSSIYCPKENQSTPVGRAISRLAQIVVVLIALAAIAYVLRMFLPRFLRNRKAGKRVKPQARVVLGERLEPDQSAADLLAEAEALARAGDSAWRHSARIHCFTG